MSGTTAFKGMFDSQLHALAALFQPDNERSDMKATVLIIEDDPDIAQLISLYLSKEGIETIHRENGELGLTVLDQKAVDLVVLDVNLPGMDGYEVLQTLRRRRDLPVILVTARQEDEDAILGFGLGADDYVSKPFSPKVLVARIRSHLSRRRISAEASSTVIADYKAGDFQFGPFCLSSSTFTLLRDGRKEPLSPREIDLLLFLASTPGTPRTQEDIYREVWGKEFGDLSTVAVHVQRIRKKIEDDPSQPQWLKTAHGRGYFLDNPES